jgi:hypothetical protein
MAIYKNSRNVRQADLPVFDNTHKPGDPVPHSGIYHCETCGKEVAANAGDGLPPQNHHQHKQGLGPIKWRAIVITDDGK